MMMVSAQSVQRAAFFAVLLVTALVVGAFCAAHPQSASAQDDSTLKAGTVDSGEQATTGKTTTATKATKTTKATTPKYAKVKRVKLNAKTKRIYNDGKVKFRAKLIPTIKGKPIKNKKIRWRVSNSKIASITENGVVQGRRSGVVKVIAQASNGKKATAKVRVIVDPNMVAQKIPVLTYHRICSDVAKRYRYNNTNLAISASLFEAQMRWLVANGYHTVSTSEFRDWRVFGTFLPRKSVLITIDDGFYETYRVAYPILKKYNLKACSFVIGSKVGEKTPKYDPWSWSDHYVGWNAIRKVRKKYPNLEFQSHTWNMHHRNGSGNGVVTSWSRWAIDQDFDRNEAFGFTAIAYPFGHYSQNLLESIAAHKSIKIGFGYMMSWPATRTSPLYNIPRFKVFGDRGLGDFINIVRTAR